MNAWCQSNNILLITDERLDGRPELRRLLVCEPQAPRHRPDRRLRARFPAAPS
ncbi:MAG: hypothetical protein MZV70_61455 [Desulfobacterales bacterium]|nr:hypothetical protein [Desulfobacterales bacterium]